MGSTLHQIQNGKPKLIAYTTKSIFIQLVLYKREGHGIKQFLSRQKHDDSDPHKIIHISFNMYSILQEKYYNIGHSAKYLVQTWSQAKSSGVKLPEVHCFSKSLDHNIQPEKQVAKPLFKENPLGKPRIGQGRAGSK